MTCSLVVLCLPTPIPAEGQIVAQAITTWDLPQEKDIVRDHNPTVCWTQIVGEDKPRIDCEVRWGGEAKYIKGLLGTRVDVTIIPSRDWLPHWELQSVATHIQGIGEMQLAKQSKSVMKIEGPNGQLAVLPPFVLDYSEPLLGRDLMAQWGVSIGIPDAPQDFWVVHTEKRPTLKLN